MSAPVVVKIRLSRKTEREGRCPAFLNAEADVTLLERNLIYVWRNPRRGWP
jgi:hypothetical protein